MEKYYTPDISEFCVGFECEIGVDETWQPCVISKGEEEWDTGYSNVLMAKSEYWNVNVFDDMLAYEYRVKLLDQQDCEELGWEHLGAQWYNLKDVPGKLGYFTHVRFRKWGDESFIKGYRGNPKDFPDAESEILFQGIIKNKSEMKRLMKMLNIQ